MDQKITKETQQIADLSQEQMQTLNKVENELGCVLVAYQTKQQSHDSKMK